MQSDDFKPTEHPTLATMQLSGSTIRIGTSPRPNPKENSIWIDSDENAEPIYISPTEAKLFIASLSAAIELAEEVSP